MLDNSLSFEVYRYQLLPKSLTDQTDLFYGVENVEQLKEAKNKIFADVLTDLSLDGRRTKIAERFLFSQEPIYAFQIGPEKNIEIQKKDFSRERVANYPSVIVVVDNRADRQLIYIQNNEKAFKETEIVAGIIGRTVSRRLLRHNLSFYINPLFNELEFWNIVAEHEGSIKSLKFEFIKPNLANISAALSGDLRRFQENTNAHKAILQANAPKDGNLEIKKDETIEGLVDYSKEGGGVISLKVRGLKRTIKTSKSKKVTLIDEAIFTGSPEVIRSFFNSLE